MTEREHLFNDRMLHRGFWILILAAAAGTACLLLWSLTYRISRTVETEGILFSSESIRRRAVTRDGMVSEVLVKLGDHVEAGDVLAVFSGGDRLSELEALQTRLDSDPENERLRRQAEGLREQYLAETIVRSPCSGEVKQLRTAGEWLKAGETLAGILPDDGYTELLAFVPLWRLNEVSVGMEVKIYPEFAPREKYGSMGGTVSKVDTVPATEESLLELMGSSAYSADLLPDEACAVVYVRVWLDNLSANGFYWSNPNGNALPVSLGTICVADIITEEYHPISLLLP